MADSETPFLSLLTYVGGCQLLTPAWLRNRAAAVPFLASGQWTSCLGKIGSINFHCVDLYCRQEAANNVDIYEKRSDVLVAKRAPKCNELSKTCYYTARMLDYRVMVCFKTD